MMSLPTVSRYSGTWTSLSSKITWSAPASDSSPKRSTTCCGDSVRAEPAGPSRTFWSVERSISAGSRPTAAQCGVEDRVLAGDALGRPEHVARVRVLGDQPERLLLAAAADHDRDPRPRDRLGRVQEPLGPILAALERRLRAALASEHLVRDPERLLEHLEPDAERREREPEGARLLLVPGGADARARHDRRTARRASSSP